MDDQQMMKGPAWPTAGAGRGKRNPPRVKNDMEKEMIQGAQDAKDREAIKAMGYSKGGSVRGVGCATKGFGFGGKVC